MELLALSRALSTQPELAARLRRAGDALMTREVATEGVTRIALERARQIGEEGRTPDADLAYGDDVLAAAGACYALPHTDARRQACRLEDDGTPIGWAFPAEAWKPGPVYQRAVVIGDEHPLYMQPADRIRELEKAGALIAAEIDRLLALQAQGGADAALRGPLHQPGMFNIDLWLEPEKRWVGGRNRATRRDAIVAAIDWCGEDGCRYRVVDPGGTVVFDTEPGEASGIEAAAPTPPASQGDAADAKWCAEVREESRLRRARAAFLTVACAALSKTQGYALAELLLIATRPSAKGDAAPAADAVMSASIIREAAEVLRDVGDKYPSALDLPASWRWPLIDELDGIAALAAAAVAGYEAAARGYCGDDSLREIVKDQFASALLAAGVTCVPGGYMDAVADEVVRRAFQRPEERDGAGQPREPAMGATCNGR
ncbi:MAG TPA: hypothetical protein VIG88_14010 [Lysobacter sp.]